MLDSPWLMRFRPRPGSRLRLACFPHGGGSASFFRSWAQQTPPDVEVVGVQYPGRMNRLSEPRIDSMERMAGAIAGVLAESLPAPFALFGHSMGAAIAFEVALLLERCHLAAPSRLYVSGQAGPARHRPGRRHLASDAWLGAHLRGLGGTDAAVLDQPDLWPLLAPVLRSDLRLIETWRPHPRARVRCPLSAFAGDRDPEAGVDQVRAWEGATEGPFALRVFPGGHFFLVEHQAALLAEIAGARQAVSGAPDIASPTVTPPEMTDVMSLTFDDAEMHRRHEVSQRAFHRALALSSPGGAVFDRDGGVQVTAVPAAPGLQMLNCVFYRDRPALGDGLGEVGEIYRRAGVTSWMVWVPPWDRPAARMLRDAGHSRRGLLAVMAVVLTELDLTPRAELDLHPHPTGELIARCNDRAYGLSEELSMVRAMSGMEGGSNRLYAARCDGEVAAVAVARHDGEHCYTWGVACTPAARRTRVTTELVRHVYREAVAAGCVTNSGEATAAGEWLGIILGKRAIGRYDVWVAPGAA